MKKKLYLTIILLMVVVLTSGCVTDGLTGGKTEKYTVQVKLINSSDDFVKNENIEVTVDGEKGTYNNGVYEFNLKQGDYILKTNDLNNTYSDTTTTIYVTEDNIINIHIFKNSKSVVLKTFDENNNLIKGTEIIIDGVDRYKTEEGYQFTLSTGKEYTANIVDPEGYYKSKETTFEVKANTDIIEFNLEKNPTGTVTGQLYLPEEYNSAEITYSNISYYDKEINSDETGYKIELPVGEREITVNTLFEGTVTKTIDVKENQTINKDIIVPLPDDYPVDKFKEYKSSFDKVYSRWKKKEINYYIGFTDWVLDNRDKDYRNIYKKSARKGVNVIEETLEGVVDYNEVDDPSNADVKIIFCHDSNSNISSGKAGLVEQKFDGREVVYSEIYVATVHDSPYIIAHELGHSLAFNHSTESGDLMHPTSYPNLEKVKEGKTDDKKIMGLVYSLEFGTKNIFY